jgi:hypothetical protein
MGRTKPSVLGQRFEKQVVDFINDWAGRKVCERIRQRGKDDEGDLRLTFRGPDADCEICVECKRRKEESGPAEIEGFRQETDDELGNSGADGAILVVNRYRRGREQAVVQMRVRTFNLIWYCVRQGRFYGTGRMVEPPEDKAGTWVSMSLGEFCSDVFGAPAWGDKREE